MKTIYPSYGNNARTVRAEVDNVAVPMAGLTELGTIPVGGCQRLMLQVAVTGHALDQFVISARTSPNAPFSVLYDLASHYINPKGLLVGASGDLTTLAAGSVGDLQMDVIGLHEVKIQVSSGNVAGSIVSAYGSAA